MINFNKTTFICLLLIVKVKHNELGAKLCEIAYFSLFLIYYSGLYLVEFKEAIDLQHHMVLESGMRVKAFINDQSLRSSFLQEVFLSRITATYACGHVTIYIIKMVAELRYR